MKIGQRYIRKMLVAGILPALLLTGCMGDEGDCTQTDRLDGKSYLALTFVTPNDGTATRAAGSTTSTTRAAENDPDGYEAGIGYEDYINISGGDYKIYFFSYEEGDTNGGTLIAEFTPDEVTSSSTSSATIYTIMGSVPAELRNVSSFRVVMLANWGNYPDTTAGTTTIDDLCEGINTTFDAFKKFVIDADNLIPFYGVQEYSNISFTSGTTTTLGTPISLLRAVAKVEVILTSSVDDDGNPNSNINEFSNVSIVNYNSQGYCAPWRVYTAADYDTEMKNNPSSGNWDKEWVDGLHLVGDTNDSGTKSQDFTHISGGTTETYDTWRIYLPEYNNMGDDYCYIQVYVDEDPYRIYFANYTNDGTTTAYDADGNADDRCDVFRNNLYRFYVTLTEGGLVVTVDTWEDVFDNEWSFGEMSHIEEAGTEFTFDGITYEVKVVRELEEGEEDEMESYGYHLEVWITQSTSKYTGEFIIPQTVTHFGYTYTITGIEGNCFFGDEDLISVQIPATVTWIGNEAFGECSSLQSFYILATTPPECGEDIFHDDVTGNITIFVPVGCKDVYSAHETWRQFTIEETNYGN